MNRINQNINPFQIDLENNLLYNISRGQAATNNIADFLLNVEINGQELHEKLIEEYVLDEKRFTKTIKQNKMTFTDTIKKKKVI